MTEKTDSIVQEVTWETVL